MRCKVLSVHRSPFGYVTTALQPKKTEAGNEFIAALESYINQWTDIEIKNKKKRSLNANAYMWTLCDKLAAKLGSTKEDVYRIFVKDYSIFDDVTVSVEAMDRLRKSWSAHGIGWFSEIVDDIKETVFILRLYSGSSVYTKSEMSRLIDAIVEECKTQGIETMTPREIDNLLNLMEVNNE